MPKRTAAGIVTALRPPFRSAHVNNLQDYFSLDYDQERHDFVPKFEGSRFEFLDGGGDKPNVADEITAADLAAVTCLGVDVPEGAMLRMLEGTDARKIRELLKEIPTGVDLHSHSDNPLGSASKAWAVWDIINAPNGMGRTTTSKILARKRPQLIPILDSVVVCALALSDTNAWDDIFQFMTQNYCAVVDELKVIQAAAALTHGDVGRISLLRVFDIIVWQQHRSECTRKSNCPGSSIFSS